MMERTLKTIVPLIAAASFAALCTSAFADPADQPGHQSPAPGTNNENVSTVKDAASVTVGTLNAAMTSTLGGFTDEAVNLDLYDVEAAKIAQQRSQKPDIKDFAAKMIDAHTVSVEKLESILTAIGSDVKPPAHLDDRRQGLIDDLRGAKDSDFDARYVSQQVDVHREAKLLMDGYQKNGDVPQAKKFAQATAPVVQSHLDMAESLYKRYQ